jgi:hypothetical protein
MTRSIRLVFWAPHLFPLDSCLLQLLIPQVLNSSLLAPSQTWWAPLSFLPHILMIFLAFVINPPMISMPFPRLIINSIYFYAPTITRMHPSNSFMDGLAIGNILPIFSIIITAFRAIIQRGEL